MSIRFLLREMTFLFALLIAASSKGENAGTLQLEKEINLLGVEGRIDHFSVDVPGQRLFVAALGNGSVEILDKRQGERAAEIKAMEVLRQHDPNNYEHVERITIAPGARTGLFVSALHRLFVSVPRRGSESAKILIYGTAGEKQ